MLYCYHHATNMLLACYQHAITMAKFQNPKIQMYWFGTSKTIGFNWFCLIQTITPNLGDFATSLLSNKKPHEFSTSYVCSDENIENHTVFITHRQNDKIQKFECSGLKQAKL